MNSCEGFRPQSRFFSALGVGLLGLFTSVGVATVLPGHAQAADQAANGLGQTQASKPAASASVGLIKVAHAAGARVEGVVKDGHHRVGDPGKYPAGGADGKRDPKRAYVQKSPHPGVVKAHRLATNEEFSIRAGTRGRIRAEAAKKFAHMMRSPTGTEHSMDTRLLALLANVSDHFGGRKIEIISGFRPYTSKQFTKDSRHNHGHAVDFRVNGVPNTVLRDYCRTLPNTGCGYYPNSVFVHMDTRTSSAYWIDYSRPGEPPRYHAPNSGADEGTSDVHADHDLDKDKAKNPDAAGANDDETPRAPSSGPSPTPSPAP